SLTISELAADRIREARIVCVSGIYIHLEGLADHCSLLSPGLWLCGSNVKHCRGMIGSQRHLHVRLSCEDYQRDPVVWHSIHQLSDELLCSFESAWLEICCQHALAHIESYHDIDSFSHQVTCIAGTAKVHHRKHTEYEGDSK